ncbi:hypothetical protein LSAT2_014014 [Lamellibrachia satsuma]|nr:hypothetical protein LSAT2_014014 [Lamellibrachia satsuma]
MNVAGRCRHLMQRFLAKPRSDLRLRPYRVSEEGFRACNSSAGQAIVTTATSAEIRVPLAFLKTGSNYFIVDSSDPLFRCEFGLRLNVTMRPSLCVISGQETPCSARGHCVAGQLEAAYQCVCCPGWTGKDCSTSDVCASQPCNNDGTCFPGRDHTTMGVNYTCRCPPGFRGPQCSELDWNLCRTQPCEHNGTCTANKTVYRCHCPSGYGGHHCEVNINECLSNPCVHGVCVDKVDGYQCFCTPGYGGHNCEDEYNECASNPCENDGFCVDGEDDYTCHCSRGYSGRHCSVKVNLCSPSPCRRATECVDYGHHFSCTCQPGYTGIQCEVNVNECVSNPCLKGGRCYDFVAGYRCICPPHAKGLHCELPLVNIQEAPSRNMFEFESPLRHFSRVQKLLIVVGTLGGALCMAAAVLAVCYCPSHLSVDGRWRRSRGYTRHNDGDSTRRVDISSVRENRPTVDAILEATCPGYHDSLNAPLVNSIKSLRV